MALKVWMFLLAMTLPELSSNIVYNGSARADSIFSDSSSKESRVVQIQGIQSDRCLARLESALGSISTQRLVGSNTAMIDLTGYALHQPLTTIPLDMYVTDMRVRVPGKVHWATVEKCRFDPNTKILQAKLTFQDLVVSASVKLFNENLLQFRVSSDGQFTDKCNMTLRLRQAGLGFVATPHHIKTGAIGIKTSATFVDPNFVSIHAYNCQPIDVNDQQRSNIEEEELRSPSTEDVSQEMEEIFLRGIRSLLTRYMEKQLQPALKDTLMLNLGYTISYGRR